MFEEEIEVPIEVREFMLEDAEETSLGQKNGANKQFRYGNLHIREYDDKYLVHMDKIDPRKDPIGHLVSDAPEVLVGLASAAIGGTKLGSSIINHNNSKRNSILSRMISSVFLGYLGYTITKKIKNYNR